MCDYLYEAEFDKLKIRAAFFGVDLEDKKGGTPIKHKKEEDDFTFKDPSEYKDMTKEEREKLTDQMMGKHRKWVSGKKGKL